MATSYLNIKYIPTSWIWLWLVRRESGGWRVTAGIPTLAHQHICSVCRITPSPRFIARIFAKNRVYQILIRGPVNWVKVHNNCTDVIHTSLSQCQRNECPRCFLHKAARVRIHHNIFDECE